MTEKPQVFLLTVLLIFAAFMIGVLWTKVQFYEKGAAPKATTQPRPAERTPQPEARVEATGKPKDVSASDHVRGNRNAQVFWIEYSDLECPFCKRIHPDLKKLVSEYKDKVAWVYRHYPIDSIHPKARKEAEASECAAELGGNDKFWEYVDKIFEVTPANNNLPEEELPKIAGQIGLNVDKFNDCLASGKFAKRVQDDLDDGVKAGVTGTPGSFVVDRKGSATLVAGAQPYEQLKAAVEAALKGN